MRCSGRAPRWRAWCVGVALLALWLSRVLTTSEYYERTWKLGWYPSDGDSTGLAEAASFVFTVLWTPVVVLMLWLALRRFPARVRLLVWSDDCLGSSLLWTALCAVFCLFEVGSLIDAAQLGLPLGFAVECCWMGAWLFLRAALIRRAEVDCWERAIL